MCRWPCAAGQVAVEKVNFMVYERLSFVVTNSGTEKSTISSLQTISNLFALMIEAMKKKKSPSLCKWEWFSMYINTLEITE